jgi:hypothetical protein
MGNDLSLHRSVHSCVGLQYSNQELQSLVPGCNSISASFKDFSIRQRSCSVTVLVITVVKQQGPGTLTGQFGLTVLGRTCHYPLKWQLPIIVNSPWFMVL